MRHRASKCDVIVLGHDFHLNHPSNVCFFTCDILHMKSHFQFHLKNNRGCENLRWLVLQRNEFWTRFCDLLLQGLFYTIPLRVKVCHVSFKALTGVYGFFSLPFQFMIQPKLCHPVYMVSVMPDMLAKQTCM